MFGRWGVLFGRVQVTVYFHLFLCPRSGMWMASLSFADQLRRLFFRRGCSSLLPNSTLPIWDKKQRQKEKKKRKKRASSLAATFCRSTRTVHGGGGGVGLWGWFGSAPRFSLFIIISFTRVRWFRSTHEAVLRRLESTNNQTRKPCTQKGLEVGTSTPAAQCACWDITRCRA